MTTGGPRSTRCTSPKLVDRFVQNLRRCAGYRVQYFAAVEPQARLAPHLHVAIRGAIPRALLRQVIRRPTSRCGGRRSTDPSTSTGSRSGPATATATPTPASCCPPGHEALDQVAGRPGRAAGARDAARHPVRRGRHHRPAPTTPTGPSATWPSTSPRPSPTRSATTTSTTRPGRRTSTGCTPSCATCPAPRAARTGSATASNPTSPAPASSPAAAARRHMTGNTSASAAAASWSPATGPARPWPNTEPTGPPSSGKPSTRPGSSPPTSNGWPPTCCRR